MPTIDISGVSHSYELFSPRGDKPVLVFIHGWLLSRHYWQPLVDILSPDYPCLVYDLRGFGDSQKITSNSPPSSYNLESYSQDVITLLNRLNLDAAWLVGHSLGGSVALWAADICPERIKGIICMNAGGGIYLKEEFERFREAGRQILQRRPPWLPGVPFIDVLFSRMMVKQTLSKKWGKQRVIDFVRADYQAALGSLLETTTISEVHLLPQIVSRLAQPVYFLAGKEDTIMEVKYVNHLASFHPLFETGGNVIELSGCGHFAMLEQTAAVAQKMMAILNQHRC
ncbi:alpha/beta fold hydrolase [Microcystis aeruginosa]|uniref:Genome sequencing data, contig C328 n=1 Tax=Microcystis aeruginosa PCC 9701 TaxID=721123 RepID=I4INT2_MICAE|nr:alpha/beta hydrolase [Microcystis aeruginosa]CCI35956.1 Genome sequencing data, contig C328 [Microcystis aeruginosa PCC 9701]